MHQHMRAHSNILRISTPIRKSKHLIPNFEPPLRTLPQHLNHPRELYAECLGGLRRYRIVAFPLEQIHPVEAEGFDFDQGLGTGGFGFGDTSDVEGFYGAGTAFDVCGIG